MNEYKNRDLCSMCALYNRCGKYEKIIEIAKYFLSQEQINEEELSVFVEGYQLLLSKYRKNIIRVFEIEKFEKKRKSTHSNLIEELIKPLREKIINICNDFDNEINKLIPKSKNYEQMIYFTRLKCDFLRYKCQFLKDEKEKKECIDLFLDNINKGEQLANEFFPKNNLRYLELELSKCVFYYEVLDKKDDAINFGKQILIDAEKKIEKKVEKKTETKIEEKIETQETQNNEEKNEKKNVEVKKENEENVNEENKEEEKKNEENTNQDFVNDYIKKLNKEEDPITKERKKNVAEILRILKTDIILWSGKDEGHVKF